MNTAKHWGRQLKRVEQAIDLFEANERSGPQLDPEGNRLTISHLYAVRNGLRRELGIAPTAAERREQL